MPVCEGNLIPTGELNSRAPEIRIGLYERDRQGPNRHIRKEPPSPKVKSRTSWAEFLNGLAWFPRSLHPIDADRAD
jgi:hypothetical protein